jgi:addiction module RelE/StbE family toxin
MQLAYTKAFLKNLRGLQQRERDAVQKALELFVQSPFAPSLRNHALKGEYLGARSIDAGFDLRIIFREQDGYVVVYLLRVGSHSQLYK